MNKTALFNTHKALGAKFISFAGWTMPLSYTSMVAEHLNVRKNVGLFDVSHMGQIEFSGNNAIEAADFFITNNLFSLNDGRALYSPMCKHNGGIIDDLIAYKINNKKVLLCVNASNVEKDYKWIVDNNKIDVTIANRSNEFSQLALQGKYAPNIIKEMFGDFDKMKPFYVTQIEYKGAELVLATTGYTGEKGYELYIAGDEPAVKLWDEIIERGKKFNICPVGLAARDTLRLEMKYCLYGNDIDETTNPIEAGLKWTVKFNDNDFIGKESIEKQIANGIKRKLVGFKMVDRGIARHGDKIFSHGTMVGHVTSGTMSPVLKEAIGLAYIDKPYYKLGSEIEVEIRGKYKKAGVVKTPFVSIH